MSKMEWYDRNNGEKQADTLTEGKVVWQELYSVCIKPVVQSMFKDGAGSGDEGVTRSHQEI